MKIPTHLIGAIPIIWFFSPAEWLLQRWQVFRWQKRNAATAELIASATGPLIINVHGTFDTGEQSANEPSWWQTGSSWRAALEQQVRHANPLFIEFRWSGNNSDADRRRAAAQLSSMLRFAERYQRRYALLGHSHGGNIIQAAITELAGIGHALPGLTSFFTYGTPYLAYKFSLGHKFTTMLEYSILLALQAWFLLAFVYGFHSALGFALHPELRQHHPTVTNLWQGGIGCAALYWPMFVLYKRTFFQALRSDISPQHRCSKPAAMHSIAFSYRSDEAFGALEHVANSRVSLANRRTARQMIRSLFSSIAFVAATIVVVIWAITVTRATPRSNPFAGSFGGPAYYVINVIAFAGVLFFALYGIATLIGILISYVLGPLASWYSNMVIRESIRSAVFGLNEKRRVRAVTRWPTAMVCRKRTLRNSHVAVNMGDAVSKVVAELYENLSTTEARLGEAKDMANRAWKTVNRNLAHSDYFKNTKVIRLTAMALSQAFGDLRSDRQVIHNTSGSTRRADGVTKS